MECPTPDQETQLREEKAAILSQLHSEPPSEKLQSYFERLRKVSDNWNIGTYIEGLRAFANVCGNDRDEYYGEGSLKGLSNTSSFVERWNRKYPQNPITFWDQNIRRQCPDDWISKFEDDCWLLIYRGGAPESHGLNNVLKGPTTLDCGMCVPLAHIFAQRYMMGDKWFGRLVQFGQQGLALTQTWSEARCGSVKNLLFVLYEDCLPESPPPIIRNKTVWNIAQYGVKHPGGYSRLENIIQVENVCIVFNFGSSSTFLSESELDHKMMQDYNATQDNFDIEQLYFLQLLPTDTHPARGGKSNGALFEEAIRLESHTVSESEWEQSKVERAQKSVEMKFDFERLLKCVVDAREAYEKFGEAAGETALTRAHAMKIADRNTVLARRISGSLVGGHNH